MENTENINASVINVVDILRAWMSRLWLIIITAVLGVTAGFCYTSLTTVQTYTTYAMMYVNNASVSMGSLSVNMSLADINANRSLVEPYAIILKSRTTLEMALSDIVENPMGEDAYIILGKATRSQKREFELSHPGEELIERGYKYSSLNSMISVNAVNETEIFKITVVCPDPDDAILIANIVADTFPSVVKNIVEGTSAKPVDYAVTASPVSRGFAKNMLVGGFIGVAAALAYVFMIDVLLNDVVSSTEAVKQILGDSVAILTVVPDDLERSGHRYGYGYGRYYRRYYRRYGYGYGYGEYARTSNELNGTKTADGKKAEEKSEKPQIAEKTEKVEKTENKDNK